MLFGAATVWRATPLTFVVAASVLNDRPPGCPGSGRPLDAGAELGAAVVGAADGYDGDGGDGACHGPADGNAVGVGLTGLAVGLRLGFGVGENVSPLSVGAVVVGVVVGRDVTVGGADNDGGDGAGDGLADGNAVGVGLAGLAVGLRLGSSVGENVSPLSVGAVVVGVVVGSAVAALTAVGEADDGAAFRVGGTDGVGVGETVPSAPGAVGASVPSPLGIDETGEAVFKAPDGGVVRVTIGAPVEVLGAAVAFSSAPLESSSPLPQSSGSPKPGLAE